MHILTGTAYSLYRAVISGPCCCSEKLTDVVITDYLNQEMDKMGQTSSFLSFLKHITQIQIDIIINVSFKYRNVKFYRNKKNQVPLRIHASEATRQAAQTFKS